MFQTHRGSLRFLSAVLVVGSCLVGLGAGAAFASEVITLRSGNAPLGNPDPLVRMLVGSGGAPLSGSAFTSADFAAACSGPNAIVTQPHPLWLQQLPCDPLAQWIGTDPLATPASALYCHAFDVQTCCIQQAILNICWATDDVLGDSLFGGPNPDGVYLNGVAVSPSISGGNYGTATQVVADVTSLVRCGANSLEIYNRDAGFAVSGVIFSAVIDIIGCPTSTENRTWGSVKALYR